MNNSVLVKSGGLRLRLNPPYELRFFVTKIGFYRFAREQKRFLASRALVALSSVFFLFLPGSTMATADIDHPPMQELKHLQDATSLVLMFVPYGMRFVVRLDERKLSRASCVYQIDSIPGPAFDEVLKIINESVLEYQKPITSHAGQQTEISNFEARFGLAFRFANRSQREFYFEDWKGKAKVRGHSSEYRIWASADFPNRLRALATRPDVVLIKGLDNECPHS